MLFQGAVAEAPRAWEAVHAPTEVPFPRRGAVRVPRPRCGAVPGAEVPVTGSAPTRLRNRSALPAPRCHVRTEVSIEYGNARMIDRDRNVSVASVASLAAAASVAIAAGRRAIWFAPGLWL